MKINGESLVEGLSYALDVAEKKYFSHSKHVAYISVSLAEELGIDKLETKYLYYAALLHDIGSSGTDSIEGHCRNGRDILRKLPIDELIPQYVYYHHEFYNGTGPFGLIGDEIPIPSQIISMADLFDYMFGSTEYLTADIIKNVNRWLENNKELFNPRLFEAFSKLISKEYVLLDYFNAEFNNILSSKVDIKGSIFEFEDVKKFAYALAKIIDNRSHFTYRHSKGIANLVKTITPELGYDQEMQHKMAIAALLHDIGKLVISNDIIDKQGKLDENERYEMNKHTYFTRWILSQIEGFEEITEYAANHHEKLNGSGYPLHLSAEQLAEPDRVMAICDIYQALTEERPYRENLSSEQVWSIIDNMVEHNDLDAGLVTRIKPILSDYTYIEPEQ